MRIHAERAMDPLKWTLDEEAIRQAEDHDGKYLLYTTDSLLPVSDVVKEYVGKDFVEKTFNTLKSHLKIAPVRPWKNHRIRAVFCSDDRFVVKSSL